MGEKRTMMNAVKRYISVMLVAALAVASIQIPAFAADTVKATKTVKVGETVTLDAPAKAVKEVGTKVVTAVTPENPVSGETPEEITKEVPVTAEVPVKWTSDNKNVATVDANGVVTGVAKGETKVTAVGAETWVYKIIVTSDTVSDEDPEVSGATPSITGTVTTSATPSITGTVTGATPSVTVTTAPGGGDKDVTGTPSPSVTGTVTSATPSVTVTTAPTGTVTSATPSVTVTTAPTGTVTTKPVTKAPTKVPTKAPTKVPTKAPTKAPEVKSVKLNATKFTLAKKATVQLNATVTMKKKGAKAPKVVWTSSKTSVATVKNGKVTAKNAGKSTITAKAGTKKATCKITVSSKKSIKITYAGLKGAKNAALNPQKYVFQGQKLTFKAPTKKGYAFKGWYVNKKLVKKSYTVPKSAKKLTVTAKWTKVTSAATKNLKAKPGKKQIKVSYAKVKGVKGYAITYKKSGSKSKTVYTTKASYTIKKLSKGTYKVSVKTYKLDSCGNKVLSKKAVSKTVKVTK